MTQLVLKSQVLVILLLHWALSLFSLQHDHRQTNEISDSIYNKLNSKDKDLLDRLKDYEIIHPHDVSPISNEFPDFYDEGGKVERSISFVVNKKNIVLDLVPNRNLFSPRYKERYFLPNGKTTFRKRTHDCFFHGHARSEEDSNLALATCDGFHGYFRINDKTFFIQPLFDQDQKITSHIVYTPDDITGPNLRCAHDGIHSAHHDYDLLNQISRKKRHRVRRDVLTETKYVELILVNDHSQFVFYESDLTKTKLRAITIANIVDSIYKDVFHIRVALVMIETWTNGNQISLVTSPQTTLSNFLNYKNNFLDVNDTTKDHDNAQLLSQMDYDGNVAGYAYIKTICRSNSAGIVSDLGYSAAFTGSLMAHEMGHNFGLQHDDSCQSCPSSNGCVMNALLSTSSPPVTFSQCSKDDLQNFLAVDNVGHCLFNHPTKFATDTACGNGFIEAGEECDCGTLEVIAAEPQRGSTLFWTY